jgi:hypothetical protein
MNYRIVLQLGPGRSLSDSFKCFTLQASTLYGQRYTQRRTMGPKEQDPQHTYSVTLWRVPVIIVATETQQ